MQLAQQSTLLATAIPISAGHYQIVDGLQQPLLFLSAVICRSMFHAYNRCWRLPKALAGVAGLVYMLCIRSGAGICPWVQPWEPLCVHDLVVICHMGASLSELCISYFIEYTLPLRSGVVVEY